MAFLEALKDAGISREDIDGLIAGPTTAKERMGEILGLDVRYCSQADAGTAVIEACLAIETGMAETIALVYGNDQRSANVQYGGAAAMGGHVFPSYVYHAPWGLTSQGAIYALMARAYMHAGGLTERDLGQFAVAQRLAASLNPRAVMRQTITIEDYLAAPYICEPLRLFDYCLINDGGVALIVTTEERAQKITDVRPVRIWGVGRYDMNKGATSLKPRLVDFYRDAEKYSAADAWEMSGLSPRDIDCVQIYDSFSIHVPIALEGFGYCEEGGVAKFVRDTGISLGQGLPVNTSGGHLSESYMQGWAQQVEAVRQVRGDAGKRQVESCRFSHYCFDGAGKGASIIYGR